MLPPPSFIIQRSKGKHLPLSPKLSWIHKDTKKIIFFFNIPKNGQWLGSRRAILSHRLLGGEWYALFTSQLVNQRLRKTPFTCVVHNKELHVYLHCEEKFCPGHSWKSSIVLCYCFCSMLLDKKFKSELVRLNAEAAAKLGTRSNRYETLLRQRHVQVRMEFSCLGKIVSVQEKNYENWNQNKKKNMITLLISSLKFQSHLDHLQLILSLAWGGEEGKSLVLLC